MILKATSCRPVPHVAAVVIGALFSGPFLVRAASPVRGPQPQFPVQFEESGTDWIACGPGYRLTISGVTARLDFLDRRGQSESLQMTITGARSSARTETRPKPELLSTSRRNYLIGSDAVRWRRNVPLWSRLRVPQVLPGVDLVYYGKGARFEYDLIVAPGVDPADIRIKYSGAWSIRIDAAGDVVLQGTSAEIVQRRPVAFQEIGGVRHVVPSSVQLDHGLVRFEFGEFNHAHSLLIDPVIDYGAYAGGDQYARIRAITTDAAGAAYVAGSTVTPTISVTSGAYKTTCGNDGLCDSSTHLNSFQNSDTFIAKFSSDGSTLEYATYLGGGGDDVPVTIALDSTGDVYVGGATTSSDFPTTPGAYMRTLSPVYQNFVTRLSADGSDLLWSTLMPKNLRRIGLDAQSNVYFLANPLVADLPTTSNAQPSQAAAAAPYLGKLDPTGSHLIYATYLAGRYVTNQGCGLTVSADGQAWVVGSSGGNLSLAYGPCLSPNPNVAQADGLLFGIDTNSGQLLHTTVWTSQQQITPIDVARDADGHIYVSGHTNSPGFPGIDANKLQTAEFVSFVLKLDAGGFAPLWTKTFDQFIFRMEADDRGHVAFFTGQTYSTSPAVAGAMYYLDPAGSVLWTTHPRNASVLAADKAGKLYIAPSFVATSNGWINSPSAGDVGLTGFMRIDPLGGSLLVLPKHIDINAGSPLIIGSVDELAFNTSYTVTTTTPWLRISNPSGLTSQITATLGASATLLRADITGLSPGTYDGSISVTSPAFANSPVTVPVRLTIPKGPSDIILPQEIVTVGTAGTEFSLPNPLPGYASFPPGSTITTQTPWITVNGTQVMVNSAGLPKGVNTGQIVISIPGQASSPFTLTVTVVITSDFRPVVWPPEINFSASSTDPSTLSGTLAVAAPSVRSVFPFRVATSVTWLHASPDTGNGYALIALTADPGGLSPGPHAGQVTVTSVSGDTTRIPVVLTIRDTAFQVGPAALAVLFSPASKPQDLTLTLRSSQPLPFNFSGGSQLAPQSGTMPADVSFRVPVDSCPNNAENGCTFGAVVTPLVVTSGNTAVRVPLIVLTRPLLPLIFPGGIVNGANFKAGPVAPGSIVAAFGADLSQSTDVAPAGGLPFRFTPWETVRFQNASLTVAPRFYYATPAQLGIQIPWDMPTGANALSISYDAAWGAAVSNSEAFQVAAVAPYIFVWGDDRGAIQNSDSTLNQPSNPAAPGSSIVVYLTGQGAVDPPLQTGSVSPSMPLSQVRGTVTATIDGQSADVLFAGLTPGYVGLCQVNLTVPAKITPGDHRLVVSVGGVGTNAVLISTK